MTAFTTMRAARTAFIAGLLVSASTLAAQGVPIIQPGAPGK